MRRACLIKVSRLLVALIVVSVLCASFGCASKRVKIYEPEPTLQTRDNLVEYATTLLGRPYRNGAKGPQAFDCSGLVHYVYERFDMTVPVSTEGLSRIGYEVSRDEMTAGDIAIFRISGDMHAGIMINDLEFIHASKSRGVAIDSLDLPYWKRAFLNFRRVF
jgi:cell wall-associated NlpC family hydrolase